MSELELQTTNGELSRWMAPMVVVFCGLIAYCNSLHGPFVFDDIDGIQNNRQLQHLIPIGPPPAKNTLTGRPVAFMSFSVQYAIWKLEVEPYHAVNLLIHLGCGLLMFGIVRRTLSRSDFWGDQFANAAPWLAAAAATIWVVHPLDTEAVTYIVQRVESMGSLFYLGVIYCLVRRLDGGNWGWELAAILSCAMGMGTKEIVVTAPAMALLYDRTFVSRSFLAALKKRWLLYAGLAATWIVLWVILTTNGRGESVGFGHGLSARFYAWTQLGVIAHYLRLAFWPRGQVFDEFNWPITQGWGQISVGGWLVLLLAVCSAAAVWLKPALGFLGAWFFVVLSPSSSFVPIVTETVAEHRMYLPLTAISTLIVVGVWQLARRSWVTRWLAEGGAVVLVIVLMGATLNRNGDYHTAESIWRDTLAKRPFSARAHFNLGNSLLDKSRLWPEGSDESIAAATDAVHEFSACLGISPVFHAARSKLIYSLYLAGMMNRAEQTYSRELQSGPAEQAGNAHFLRGAIRANRNDLEGAKSDFEAVIASDPNDPEVHYQLGLVFQGLRQWKDAEAQFNAAIQMSDGGFRDAAKRLQDVQMSEAISTE